MTPNIKHFEDLWCEAEKLSKELNPLASTASILDEIMLKINLYKSLDDNSNISAEEKQKTKEFILGEILLSFTNLSYTDDINVFKSLQMAIKYKSIDLFKNKS